jgi:phage shock protein PspC (stress-responsive transcriptional regulator)
VNRVRLFTCLALVLVIVAFVAVWMTIPSETVRVKKIA